MICLIDTTMCTAKTADVIEIPFGMMGRVGRRNCGLDPSMGKGTFGQVMCRLL